MTHLTNRTDGSDIIYASDINIILNKIQNGTDFDLNIAGVVYPTGLTSTRIQNAVNALPNSGGKVYLSASSYTIGTSISLPSYVVLEGASSGFTGPITTLALSSNVNGSIINNSDQVNGNTNIHIKNMFLRGNSANQTAGHGIFLAGSGASLAAKSIVENVYIKDCKQDGIRISAAKECILRDLYIDSPLAEGINFISGTDSQILGCQIAATNNGIALDTSSGYNHIRGNFVFLCGSRGIISNGGIGNTIIGNRVNSNNGSGIQISSNATGCIVVGNEIFNNGQVAIGARAGILVESEAAVIIGNRIFDNQVVKTQQQGIELSSVGPAAKCIIIGNSLYGNSDHNLLDISASGNHIIRGNIGATSEAFGNASVSHGTTIAHGLYGTPTIVTLTSQSVLPRIMSITAKGGTTFTVGVLSTTGTAVSNTRAYWYAEV